MSALTETEIGTIAPDWKVAPLERVCEPPQYGFTASAEDSGNVRFLRITDITDSGVKWPTVPFCDCPAELLNKYLLGSGDIVFARIGATTGKSYLITNPPPCVFASYLIRVRAKQEIDPTFLSYFFLSAAYWHQVDAQKNANLKKGVSGSLLKTLIVPVPPLAEQRKIAGVLGLVQRALEQEERLLQLTAALKKTLLHQLFTQGLRGEPQKHTEIGPVPESWNLVPCEDLCEMITVGVVVKPASHYVEKGVPAFRSFNVREDRLAPNDLVYFSKADNDTALAKSKLRAGDVLVVRTGYPGTSCVVPKEYDGANCIDLVIVRPKAGVARSGFLSRFFNAPAGKRQAVAAKHGLAQQHLNVGAVKRTRIAVPSLEEQDEIDFVLSTIQRKIFRITARKKALEDLFRTLLHQLMTAQIRVHDLDLPELEQEGKAEMPCGST